MSFSATTTGDEVVKHFAPQVSGRTCKLTLFVTRPKDKAHSNPIESSQPSTAFNSLQVNCSHPG